MWCVPALIYAFGNNIQFLVMKKLNSPVSALIFGSTEIIHVGIASMIILHKKYLFVYIIYLNRLNAIQWCSLFLLCIGVANSEISSCENCSHFSDYPLFGALLAIFNAGVAGLGGVIIEKLMKRNVNMSFWQQSSYLYTFGFLINLISVCVQNKKETLKYLKFKNFNVYSYTLIFLYPYLGLITGGILKHLSSIIKTFATCCSLFLTSFISYYLFVFDLKYHFFKFFFFLIFIFL